MEPVPFQVFEAAVRVAGEALHWKSSLKQIMRNSGVTENGYARYSDLSKYQIFRHIWDDLANAGGARSKGEAQPDRCSREPGCPRSQGPRPGCRPQCY